MDRRSFIKSSGLAALAIPSLDVFGNLLPPEIPSTGLISSAYRITNSRTMLNAEFYFMNMESKNGFLFIKKKQLSVFSQDEGYMIVRIPQQHILEESKNMDNQDGTINGLPNPQDVLNRKEDVYGGKGNGLNAFTCQSRIAGYSYLVFRIVFRNRAIKRNGTSGKQKIRITVKDLLDWNADHFKLVIRRNINNSLFNIQTNFTGNKENQYPFQTSSTIKNNQTVVSYTMENIPRVYGHPVTSIEAPYQLFLSPNLPNQDLFDFYWRFTTDEESSSNEAYLWMATLTLRKTESLSKPFHPIKENELNLPPLDVMMIGVAPKDQDALNNQTLQNSTVLPSYQDKVDLVNLYIKHKIAARTPQMTFTPYGLTSRIVMVNHETEINNINIYKWVQDVSLGRDQEVEVTRLFVESVTGLKFLLIDTTKRKTKVGISYLDRRMYVMPLELEKNYADPTNPSQANARNTYRRLRLSETQAKRIRNISDHVARGLAILTEDGRTTKAIVPVDLNYLPISYAFEFEDLRGNAGKATMKLNLLGI